MAQTGLIAVIGANADPMKKELTAVEKMAERAGKSLRQNIGSTATGHGARGGVIGEMFVLMREIGRGNWARVPGSITILAQRMGFLKLIMKETAAQEILLADAHVKQAAALEKTAKASATRAVNAASLWKRQLEKVEAMDVAAQVGLGKGMTGGPGQLERAWERHKLTQLNNVKIAQESVAASTKKAADAALLQAAASAKSAAALKDAGMASKMAIGPIGWLAIGVIALGTALYFTWKHIKTTTEQARTLRDMLDVLNVKFTTQAEIMKSSAEAAQANVDWLNKLGEAQEGLADKTEDAMKAQKEQYKFQRELAEMKGASKKQLAQMDIEEAQKELDIAERGKLEASRKLEQDKLDEQKAFSDANDDHRSGRIRTLTEKSAGMGAVLDDIQKQMRDAGMIKVIDEVASRQSAVAGGGPVYKYRKANNDDAFTVKVNGVEMEMSFNEAKEAWDSQTAQLKALERKQKELSDILEQKKKLTEQDNAAVLKLKRESEELKSDLSLKQKYLPQLAVGGKMEHGHVNALQQIGGYAAPAIDIQKGMLHELKSINAKMGNRNPQTTVSGRGVNFGGP